MSNSYARERLLSAGGGVDIGKMACGSSSAFGHMPFKAINRRTNQMESRDDPCTPNPATDA